MEFNGVHLLIVTIGFAIGLVLGIAIGSTLAEETVIEVKNNED